MEWQWYQWPQCIVGLLAYALEDVVVPFPDENITRAAEKHVNNKMNMTRKGRYIYIMNELMFTDSPEQKTVVIGCETKSNHNDQ